MVLRNKLSVLWILRTSLSLSLEDHSGSFCYSAHIEYRLPCNPHAERMNAKIAKNSFLFSYFVYFVSKNNYWNYSQLANSHKNFKSIQAISCLSRPCAPHKFRLFRFRSPLLTESLMIYFPGATWMFRFAPCPTQSYITHTLSIKFSLRSGNKQILQISNVKFPIYLILGYWLDYLKLVFIGSIPSQSFQKEMLWYLRTLCELFLLRVTLLRGWVASFGNRRIKGLWHLPDEYRRRMRPSSAKIS